MSLAIVFDTETSTLPLYKERSDDIRQPHIVQLAAALVDINSREIKESMDVIVRPEGWDFDPEAVKAHGITVEMASDVGIPEKVAVDQFLSMIRDYDANIIDPPFRLRIAHNEPFDARILRIALFRYFSESLADSFRAGPSYCTQKEATRIMKLPPSEKMKAKNMRFNKTANLGEAYRYFTDRELVGAHDAMVDLKACMEVYFAIQDSKVAA